MYLLELYRYPTTIEATGPPLLTMMWRGTEILKIKAALLSKFTDMKNAVYMAHDFKGMAGFEMNRDLSPAAGDKIVGSVRSAMITNCAKVMRVPISYYQDLYVLTKMERGPAYHG